MLLLLQLLLLLLLLLQLPQLLYLMFLVDLIVHALLPNVVKLAVELWRRLRPLAAAVPLPRLR